MVVFCILRPVDIWTPGIVFPLQGPGSDNTTISIYIYMHHIYTHTYIVHEHTPQAKPGFCSGGRTSCKPNNGALLSTSIYKMMIVKVPIIVHCLVPVPIATMIVKVLVQVWIYQRYY